MRRTATAYCGQLQVGQVYVMAVLGLALLPALALRLCTLLYKMDARFKFPIKKPI